VALPLAVFALVALEPSGIGVLSRGKSYGRQRRPAHSIIDVKGASMSARCFLLIGVSAFLSVSVVSLTSQANFGRFGDPIQVEFVRESATGRDVRLL
jgi:hypothetical protein